MAWCCTSCADSSRPTTASTLPSVEGTASGVTLDRSVRPFTVYWEKDVWNAADAWLTEPTASTYLWLAGTWPTVKPCDRSHADTASTSFCAGANRARNCAAVRNLPYWALPGVETAAATRAAVSPPRFVRYTRKSTWVLFVDAPTLAAGRAHEGTLPGRMWRPVADVARAGPAVAAPRTAAMPSMDTAVRLGKDMKPPALVRNRGGQHRARHSPRTKH